MNNVRYGEQEKRIKQQDLIIVKNKLFIKNIVVLLTRAIELRDPYTKGHSEFVSKYSTLLAKECGFKSNIEFFQYGSFLHDIGKIAIPDYVLNKPTLLTKAEMDMIKKHPLYGKELIENLNFDEVIYNCVLYHHEACDGSGYPFGLKKEEIPLEARILTIVDHFNALTTKRPYRDAMSIDEALELMWKQKEKYDPYLFDIFREKVLPIIEKNKKKEIFRI